MSELDPQEHIRKQRNISSSYALSNIIQHEPHFDAVLQLLSTRLEDFCNSDCPVKLDQWFTFFAFDAVGEVIFSKSFSFLEHGKDIRDAIANQRLLAPYAAFYNLTLGNPLLSRLGIQPSSHIFETCIEAINTRKQNPATRNDII
ncbi:benzoate 4-monooxygenase cytochrome P450 [Penicillium daleae]|uniref:Benzoate 4-monooxygenase cytochrome P450 n=1 Tax=Penicillium daleae TaxID=63821 RepID=A0AAD6G5S7_9EURO|nr:benzoate 4-monooxygenase cytochrome P450 [Penicillium daleae]KAJ5459880.1 benzoate 4-monooxygenase cytochrome P450 [Penicillium daleae]